MKRETDSWCESLARSALAAVFVVTLGLAQAQARDAAFLDPGTSNSGASDEAVRVEPKGDIDTGESIMNVPRRTTVFFVNQTNQPVQVEKVTANGDGNVTTEITNDDCSKQGTIPAQSRCSVEVAVTPTSPGSWSVELLLTHNGAGRIARSKLNGKTTGATTAERKDTGLALSTKEAAPVSFGDVEVGAKAVRSALMVNDSPDAITLYAIDVIEAENGLQRLDQGCAVDMELKPGESCPVTLVWTPENNGQISTDLIIRHSGRLGFAVIPIRGNAKGGMSLGKESGKLNVANDGSKITLPPPPSAQDLEKVAAGHIPAMSADALGGAPPPSTGTLRLIGTVGNRAVLLKPDGETAVVNIDEVFNMGEKEAKVIVLTSKSAVVMVDGKKKELALGAAPELMMRAKNKDAGKDSADTQSASSSGGFGSTVSGATLGAPLTNTPSGPPSLTPMLPPAVGATK